MRDGETTQHATAIHIEATAGRFIGVMGRYNVLERIAVTDCRNDQEVRREDAEQFVIEALMGYYNEKG